MQQQAAGVKALEDVHVRIHTNTLSVFPKTVDKQQARLQCLEITRSLFGETIQIG